MKRSEMNAALKAAVEFIQACGIHLPPFAYWRPEEWAARVEETQELRDVMLGWDVTDFGSGNFKQEGLTAFTLRNGKAGSAIYPKPYAEKLLIEDEGQHTPYHFHWYKMEDIINRGGGRLCVQLYNSTPEETFADTPVNVRVDGQLRVLPAGGVVTLLPGESICLTPGLYHQFWAEGGMALLGEVSMCNDDNTDNRFYHTTQRFTSVLEDEAPLYLLANEYPAR